MYLRPQKSTSILRSLEIAHSVHPQIIRSLYPHTFVPCELISLSVSLKGKKNHTHKNENFIRVDYFLFIAYKIQRGQCVIIFNLDVCLSSNSAQIIICAQELNYGCFHKFFLTRETKVHISGMTF